MIFHDACDILRIRETELGVKLFDKLAKVDTYETINNLFGKYARQKDDFDAVCSAVQGLSLPFNRSGLIRRIGLTSIRGSAAEFALRRRRDRTSGP